MFQQTFQNNNLPLGLTAISSFIFNGRFNEISLLVIPVFPGPVQVCGDTVVSYIAKNTCDKSVILPMNELALYTPCHVYSLLVLFKTNSKPYSLIVFPFIVQF